MKSYAGKIGNGGTNVVKAPYPSKGGNKGTTRVTGNDLRNGGGKKGR